MAMPMLNTYSVNEKSIGLYWKASPKSDIKQWNIYGAPSVTVSFLPPEHGAVLPGLFTKIVSGIANYPNENTPGSVYLEIPRTMIGIGIYEPYYFILTGINDLGVETTLQVDDIHAVQFRDAYFVDEAGQAQNIVYSNWELDLWPMIAWDPNNYINVLSLLGRPGKEVKIDALGGDAWVRFNAIGNDPISIRESSPYRFDMKRGELEIRKIFIHNPTGDDITIRIFVAG